MQHIRFLNSIKICFGLTRPSSVIEYSPPEVTDQHGGRKDNTIILTNGQLAISTTTGEAHGWQHHIGEKLA
jgi:hypothetical protein